MSKKPLEEDSNHLCILLRDLKSGGKTKPVKMLVEVMGDGFSFIEEFQKFAKLAKKFVKKVKGSSDYDIYIGWWGSQDTLDFSLDFLKIMLSVQVKD